MYYNVIIYVQQNTYYQRKRYTTNFITRRLLMKLFAASLYHSTYMIHHKLNILVHNCSLYYVQI